MEILVAGRSLQCGPRQALAQQSAPQRPGPQHERAEQRRRALRQQHHPLLQRLQRDGQLWWTQALLQLESLSRDRERSLIGWQRASLSFSFVNDRKRFRWEVLNVLSRRGPKHRLIENVCATPGCRTRHLLLVSRKWWRWSTRRTLMLKWRFFFYFIRLPKNNFECCITIVKYFLLLLLYSNFVVHNFSFKHLLNSNHSIVRLLNHLSKSWLSE